MNEEMMENYEAEENITDEVEVTDLAECSSDSEGGIGAGEIAIGALALVGGAFIVKKAYDGGKWVVGKAKNLIDAAKEKKAAKKAEKEAGKSTDEVVDAAEEDVRELDQEEKSEG